MFCRTLHHPLGCVGFELEPNNYPLIKECALNYRGPLKSMLYEWVLGSLN